MSLHSRKSKGWSMHLECSQSTEVPHLVSSFWLPLGSTSRVAEVARTFHLPAVTSTVLSLFTWLLSFCRWTSRPISNLKNWWETMCQSRIWNLHRGRRRNDLLPPSSDYNSDDHCWWLLWESHPWLCFNNPRWYLDFLSLMTEARFGWELHYLAWLGFKIQAVLWS